jgi:hypothetical protein
VIPRISEISWESTFLQVSLLATDSRILQSIPYKYEKKLHYAREHFACTRWAHEIIDNTENKTALEPFHYITIIIMLLPRINAAEQTAADRYYPPNNALRASSRYAVIAAETISIEENRAACTVCFINSKLLTYLPLVGLT